MTGATASTRPNLSDQIKARIEQGETLAVDSFMAACLADPEAGYYQSRDPFGRSGDFVTAPEISGLFGEMCAAYLAHMFEIAGAPPAAQIVEFGPGRGTLMRDMHRVWGHLVPAMAALPVNLVETSQLLRKQQAALLAPLVPEFHDSADSLPQAPLFGIANEFFDALPISQLVWLADQGGWHHRHIGLVDGRLGFITGPRLTDAEERQFALALPQAPTAGMIAEICPMAEIIMANLAHHIGQNGGAVLVIDYGRNGNGGDSLQAVADHRPVDPLETPGEADLSHWVDFAALGRAATASGCRLIGPVPQGRFLMRIGLAARAEQAGLHAEPADRRALLAAIDRLTSPAQMGEVFKVALLVPPGTGTPPGFDAGNDDATNFACRTETE